MQQKLIDLHGKENLKACEEARKIQQELQMLLDREDLHWKQRAKVAWLKHGDRNTRYYHECANARRKKNFIDRITDTAGKLWDTPDTVEQAFVDYFMGLFQAGPMGDMDPCVRNLTAGISMEMNMDLLKEFTREEVTVALFQMSPLKAPGPDGFIAEFFQKNWTMVGNEVCNAVLEIINSGVMPSSLNFTHIVLIPKSKTPSCVTKFRPIRLCNVLYKLISKVLANRL